MQRPKSFTLVFVFAFLIIIGRLIHLQIIQGKALRLKSEKNRIQLIKRPPARGNIYFANGEILVDNRPDFSAFFIPWTTRQASWKQSGSARLELNKVLPRLEAFMQIDRQDLEKKIKEHFFLPFQPILVAENLDPPTVSRLMERELDFPGIRVEIQPKRNYPDKDLAAHILGYVQEISRKDLEKFTQAGYTPGDFIGQTGIERSYEEHLKGSKGAMQIEIDARGRPVQVLAEKETVKGASIFLTLNKRIQQACEQALQNKKGAIIVMDPANGEILGLASSPSFNPEMFTRKIRSSEWQRIVNSRNHPLLNRAISALYPPASTFKIITAIAALEEGLINPRDSFICEGSFALGDRVFGCWEEKGHGKVDFIKAMAQSCDVYFYHLALKVGAKKLGAYARTFGLGEFSRIDLGGEQKGLVPDPSWKRRIYKAPWYTGDSLIMAIGQGFLLTTPLQMLNVLNGLINEGKIYRPHVVKKIVFPDGKKMENLPEVIFSFTLKPSTVHLLKESLRMTVTEGTAKLANIPQWELAGKTGTAQNPHGENHAWFIGFAPYENSHISLVVFVEGGGGGGGVAAPLAARILETGLGIDAGHF